MRKIRLSALACFVVVAIAGAVQLAGCTNTGQQPSATQGGMIEGRGLDYTH